MNQPSRGTMNRIRGAVCQYKCGECGWEFTGAWFFPQMHYYAHRGRKLDIPALSI